VLPCLLPVKRVDSLSLKKIGGAGIGDGLGLRFGLRLLLLAGVAVLRVRGLLERGTGVLRRGAVNPERGEVLRSLLELTLVVGLDVGQVGGIEKSRPTCPPAPGSGTPCPLLAP
jgi:hypothetical protein